MKSIHAIRLFDDRLHGIAYRTVNSTLKVSKQCRHYIEWFFLFDETTSLILVLIFFFLKL